MKQKMKPNSARRTTAKILIVGAALIATTTVGVAIAAVVDDGPAATVDQNKSVGAISKLGDLPVFRESAADRISSQSKADLNAIADSADRSSLTAKVDLATAVRAPIVGSDDSIWIARAGEDGLCVFVPANGSFSSACGSKEDVEATGLLGYSQGMKHSESIAYQVVPEGGPAITVTSVAGESRKLSGQLGVSAAVVDPTDKISNGVVSYDLAKLSAR